MNLTFYMSELTECVANFIIKIFITQERTLRHRESMTFPSSKPQLCDNSDTEILVFEEKEGRLLFLCLMFTLKYHLYDLGFSDSLRMFSRWVTCYFSILQRVVVHTYVPVNSSINSFLLLPASLWQAARGHLSKYVPFFLEKQVSLHFLHLYSKLLPNFAFEMGYLVEPNDSNFKRKRLK